MDTASRIVEALHLNSNIVALAVLRAAWFSLVYVGYLCAAESGLEPFIYAFRYLAW